MTAIGSLNVDMNLNSAAFIENMNRAAASVTASADTMKASLSGVATSFDGLIGGVKGLMGALVVQQLVSFTEKTVGAAAEVAFLAETVGLTTDQFQKYQIAAEEVGISQEKFNSGIQRFASNLGAAMEDTGMLSTALKKLNPDLLDQLKATTSTNAALDLLMKYLNTLPDGAEKARIAAAAFGRGMQEAGQMAKALTEDIPAIKMPPEVIQGAKDLAIQFSLMQTAVENGFATGIVAAFSRDLNTSDDDLVKATKQAQQFGFIVGSALDVAVTGVMLLITRWEELNRVVVAIVPGLSAIELIMGHLDSLSQWATNAVEGTHNLWVQMTGLGTAIPLTQFDKATTNADSFTAAMARLKLAVSGQGDSGGVGGAIAIVDKKTQDWLKTITLTTANTNTLIAAVGKGPVAFEQMKAALTATDEVQKKLGTTTGALAQQVIAALTAEKQATFVLSTSTALYQASLSPMEQYKNKLDEIALAQQHLGITATQASQLQMQATATLVNTYLGAAAAMGNAVTQLFSKNKAVAIASAVINTAEAITAALKNPPGPPFSFAYAAAAAAAGAAQIATILSAQPGSAQPPAVHGSSGTVSVPSGSSGSSVGASSAASGSAAPAAAVAPLQQSISVHIEGDTFGRSHIEAFVNQLKQYQRDGGTILIT